MKESATRVATLLTVIGNNATDIFNTLTWDAEVMTKRLTKYYRNLNNTVNRGKTSVTRDTSSFQEPKKMVKPLINVTVLRKLSKT